jgi:hypothetical protein
MKPNPNQAVGSVVATEGGKTAKFRFKILWIDTEKLTQPSLVDPMVSGYIDVPRPSKSARPGECIEFDLTNPACFPGGGGTKSGPTPAQIARAKQLGEQIETQSGTEPAQTGGAVSEQPGQLIPPGYTGTGEETEKGKETTAQLWPPRRPMRGGVEEIVEGPLIPGIEPAAKPPTRPQVSTLPQPGSKAQSTPAQPATPSGLPGYANYRIKYVLNYKTANDESCTYTRYEDVGPKTAEEYKQHFAKRKKWLEDNEKSCQWKYENNAAGTCYPFKDAPVVIQPLDFNIDSLGKIDRKEMHQHPQPRADCG